MALALLQFPHLPQEGIQSVLHYVPKLPVGYGVPDIFLAAPYPEVKLLARHIVDPGAVIRVAHFFTGPACRISWSQDGGRQGEDQRRSSRPVAGIPDDEGDGGELMGAMRVRVMGCYRSPPSPRAGRILSDRRGSAAPNKILVFIRARGGDAHCKEQWETTPAARLPIRQRFLK
jgi:hypothetical protein